MALVAGHVRANSAGEDHHQKDQAAVIAAMRRGQRDGSRIR